MQQTAFPDVNRILKILLPQMRRILRERLVGVYLYGSLTMGDFDLDISDIDLLAATLSPVDETEFEALQEMHRDLASDNKEWDDRIEVAYLSVSALKTFRVHSSSMAVISPGEPFHAKEAGKEWLQNWYLVQESGVALFGPPAKTIIPPITQDEFVEAVGNYAAELGQRTIGRERKGQAYVILAMCRALYTHRNGESTSKKQAAVWAQEEMPQWSRLIQSALEWREAWREENVDHTTTYAEAVRFVNFMRDEITTQGT